jgi:hypothetical protein
MSTFKKFMLGPLFVTVTSVWVAGPSLAASVESHTAIPSVSAHTPAVSAHTPSSSPHGTRVSTVGSTIKNPVGINLQAGKPLPHDQDTGINSTGGVDGHYGPDQPSDTGSQGPDTGPQGNEPANTAESTSDAFSKAMQDFWGD